jgi:hypothetical protein
MTSSGSAGLSTKLLDGVRDNYAWAQAGDKEKFIELNLTKVKPVFDHVAVYGNNVADMELLVKNGSELTVPAIKEVITEEFSKIYILEEKISPEALRMEFMARSVELYEIEVF